MSKYQKTSAIRLALKVGDEFESNLKDAIDVYKKSIADPEKLYSELVKTLEKTIKLFEKDEIKKDEYKSLLSKLKLSPHIIRSEFGLSISGYGRSDSLRLNSYKLKGFFLDLFKKANQSIVELKKRLTEKNTPNFSPKNTRKILDEIFKNSLDIENDLLKRKAPTLKEAIDLIQKQNYHLDDIIPQEFSELQETLSKLSKVLHQLKESLSTSHEVITASLNEHALTRQTTLKEREESIKKEEYKLSEDAWKKFEKEIPYIGKVARNHEKAMIATTEYIGRSIYNDHITVEELSKWTKKFYKILAEGYKNEIKGLKKEIDELAEQVIGSDIGSFVNSLNKDKLIDSIKINDDIKNKATNIFKKYLPDLNSIKGDFLFKFLRNRILKVLIDKLIEKENKKYQIKTEYKNAANNLAKIIRKSKDDLEESEIIEILLNKRQRAAQTAGENYTRIINRSSFIDNKNKVARYVGNIKAKISTYKKDKRNLTHLALYVLDKDGEETALALIPKQFKKEFLYALEKLNKPEADKKIYKIESLTLRSAKSLMSANLGELIPFFKAGKWHTLLAYKTFLVKYLLDAGAIDKAKASRLKCNTTDEFKKLIEYELKNAKEQKEVDKFIEVADKLICNAKERFGHIKLTTLFAKKSISIIEKNYSDLIEFKKDFSELYNFVLVSSISLGKLIKLMQELQKRLIGTNNLQFENLFLLAVPGVKKGYRQNRRYLKEEEKLLKNIKKQDFNSMRLNPEMKIFLELGLDPKESEQLKELANKTRRGKDRLNVVFTVTKDVKEEDFLPAFSQDDDLETRISELNKVVNENLKDAVRIGLDRGEAELVSAVFGKIKEDRVEFQKVKIYYIDYKKIFDENQEDAVKIFLNPSLLFDENKPYTKYIDYLIEKEISQENLSYAKIIKDKVIVNADISSVVSQLMYIIFLDLNDDRLGNIRVDKPIFVDKTKIIQPKFKGINSKKFGINASYLSPDEDITEKVRDNFILPFVTKILEHKLKIFNERTLPLIKAGQASIETLLKNTKEALASNIAGVIAYLVEKEFNKQALIHLEDLSTQYKDDHSKSGRAISREFEWALYRRLGKIENEFDLVPPRLGQTIYFAEIKKLKQAGIIKYLPTGKSSSFCPKCHSFNENKIMQKCQFCDFEIGNNDLGIDSPDTLAAYNLIYPEFEKKAKQKDLKGKEE